MLVSLSSQQAARQRLWIGELPDIAFIPENTITRTFAAAPPGISSSRRVAVEKWLPVSGATQHGIIGATYEPAASEHLHIKIGVREQEDAPLDWTLGSQTDTVYAGLYPEYAEAILESFGESDKLQGGIIQIQHAAHGLVGSSPYIFKRIAHTLILMLFSADVWNFVQFTNTEITR